MELDETREAPSSQQESVNAAPQSDEAAPVATTSESAPELAQTSRDGDYQATEAAPLPTGLNAPQQRQAAPATAGATISASVGKNGENKEADVKQVQTLLNKNGAKIAADGKMGPKTIKAIEAFQQSKLGFKDGLVEPGQQTWKALNGESVSSQGSEEAGAQGKADKGQNIDPKSVSPKPTPEQQQQGKDKGQDKGGNANAPVNGKLIYEDIAVQKHGDKFVQAIKELGQRIGLNPNFIMATMKMESGFDPAIVNPKSGATGLVQFMPDTAKGLGTTVAALGKMSAIDQLVYVEKYYKSTGVNPSKIKEPAESYLLVFYPAAVGKPDDFVLGSESKKDPEGRVRKIALQNAPYDLNKDGKITKGEVLEYQRQHKFKEVYELMDKGGDTAAPAKDDKSGKGGKETSTKQTTSGNETTSTADQNKQKTDTAKDGKQDKGGKGGEPDWLRIARAEDGVKEIKGAKHSPRVLEYHSTTGGFKDDETPWCSSFVNWVMKKAGKTGTNSASAMSWAKWGKQLDKPALGSIAVISYGGGKGHVGFVVGKKGNRITLLGGNQGDQVKESNFGLSKIKAFVVPSDYEVPQSAYTMGEGNDKAGEADFANTR